jgi:hypothetical protein
MVAGVRFAGRGRGSGGEGWESDNAVHVVITPSDVSSARANVTKPGMLLLKS